MRLTGDFRHSPKTKKKGYLSAKLFEICVFVNYLMECDLFSSIFVPNETIGIPI